MTCTAKPCAMRGRTFPNGLGSWVWLLGLRLLLAYEFWQSGIEKFRATRLEI